MRKKSILIGDQVLVKRDFDNNPLTKKIKFQGFYEEDVFEVLENNDFSGYKLKNLKTEEISIKNVSLLKKIKI